MTKKIDDLLEDLENKARETFISDNVEDLQREVISLRKTLESYGIIEEIHVTNVEFICQKAIDNLKVLALSGALDSDAAKVLDILHKNLRIARGPLVKKEAPGKATSEADLLRIVNGSKKQSK